MPEPTTQQPRRCNVPGCGRPHYAKDYCQAHYRRLWRHGNPFIGIKIGDLTNGQRPIRRDCCEAGCNRPHIAQGLCMAHYQRARRARS